MSEWHLHPDVLLLVLLLEGSYLALALRGVRLAPRERHVTQRQLTLYSLGVLVLWVAAGTPLHEYGEKYLFSAHMIQHLLMSMVAPPLLLLGLPGWMLRPLVAGPRRLRVAQVITFPIVAIALFNGWTLYSHLPNVMDFMLTHHGVHFFGHVALVTTAMLMWWPVFSPMPELPRIPFAGQMVYLFVQSLVPSIVASFITYSGTLFYQFYASAPRRWGLTPIQDQVLAGLIMKLSGAAVIFGLMTIVFFRWFNQEQREHPDALEQLDLYGLPPELVWEEVEVELDRMGLTGGTRR